MNTGVFLRQKSFEESQATEKSVRRVNVSLCVGQEGRQSMGEKLRDCVYVYIRGRNHKQSKDKLKEGF